MLLSISNTNDSEVVALITVVEEITEIEPPCDPPEWAGSITTLVAFYDTIVVLGGGILTRNLMGDR